MMFRRAEEVAAGGGDDRRNQHRGRDSQPGNRHRETMDDGSNDRDSDQRRHDYRGHLHQQVRRDQYGNDRTADIYGDDRRVGGVANRHSVANTETADHCGVVRPAGGNARDGNIDVAADETHEQSGECQLGWQADRHECVVDDVDFEQDKKEGEDEEEDDRVESEERCEKHGAMIAGGAREANVAESRSGPRYYGLSYPCRKPGKKRRRDPSAPAYRPPIARSSAGIRTARIRALPIENA